MTRFYRAALRLLPAGVRERHGAQMAAVFDDLIGEAMRRGGRRRAARVTAREVAALAWFAWCEHRGAPPPRRIDERVFTWPAAPSGRPSMVSSVMQDLRYAARMLGRTPGFTVVCVLTMALAIGANTAIFSVVHAVLLEQLPYRDPARIVVLGQTDGAATTLGSTTPGNYYDWAAGATAFESMAGYAYTLRTVRWNGQAERVLGAVTVGDLFAVVGRTAAAGRTYTAQEDHPGAAPAVVLSARFARRLFGDDTAIGRALDIGDMSWTVVGVMPDDFAFPDFDAEYWIPARFDAAFAGNRDQYFLRAVARLEDGQSPAQAQVQLDTVMDRIRLAHPQATQSARALVQPMHEVLVGNVRVRLLVLLGAVAAVLLIACANIGNLLMARAGTRRREMAVRQALGARPARLLRQMLTESTLLAVVGGLAGVGLGALMLDALRALLPEDLPRAQGIALDPAVLAFGAAATMAAGFAFGLAPALQLATGGPADALRERTSGGGSRRLRVALVVSEVALTLILLAGAGLLVRSFGKLVDVDPGFRRSPMLTFGVALSGSAYQAPEQRVAFFDTLRDRLRTLPGVEDVTMSSTLPVAGRGIGAWFNILDRPLPPEQTPPAVPYRVVSPGYFAALGIPLLRGRVLDDTDTRDGRRAVVISASVARRFWPDADPIGARIYLGAPDNRLIPDGEIVGVVGDVKQVDLAEADPQAVYLPHRVMPSWNSFTIALRTTVPPETLAAAARAEVQRLDAGVPLVRVQTLDDIVARSTAAARASMLLSGLFAGLALILAVVGVFGVLSYTVTQRLAELSIRMALGATTRHVRRQILGTGMAPVLTGVILGLAGALGLSRFMESLLFGVTATDPAIFAGAALLLAAVAAVASYLPARRAARVDPMSVLRPE